MKGWADGRESWGGGVGGISPWDGGKPAWKHIPEIQVRKEKEGSLTWFENCPRFISTHAVSTEKSPFPSFL